MCVANNSPARIYLLLQFFILSLSSLFLIIFPFSYFLLLFLSFLSSPFLFFLSQQADLDKARECVNHCAKMCKKLMKNSLFDNISKLVITPNYDKYTDRKCNFHMSTFTHFGKTTFFTCKNCLKIVFNLIMLDTFAG